MRAVALLALLALLASGCSGAPPAAPSSASGPAASSSGDPAPVATPEKVTGEFHLLAAPEVTTAAPKAGAQEITTPVTATYANPLGEVTSKWSYKVLREGAIGVGETTLHLRALHPVLLAARAGSADSCTFILFIRIVASDGEVVNYDSVGCHDAPGLQQPGDFTVTMDLAWGGGTTGNHVNVAPGMTVEFEVGANYVDPQGGGLVVVSGTPDMDSTVYLPSMREPVAGVLELVTGNGG